jgi:hypothetical protein
MKGSFASGEPSEEMPPGKVDEIGRLARKCTAAFHLEQVADLLVAADASGERPRLGTTVGTGLRPLLRDEAFEVARTSSTTLSLAGWPAPQTLRPHRHIVCTTSRTALD